MLWDSSPHFRPAGEMQLNLSTKFPFYSLQEQGSSLIRLGPLTEFYILNVQIAHQGLYIHSYRRYSGGFTQ